MNPTDRSPGDLGPPLPPEPESPWDDADARPHILVEARREDRRRPVDESRGSISTGRWMWEGVKAISTAFVLFLLIRTFIVGAYKIPTGSMENTLMIGDFLLVNMAVYGAEIPMTHSRLPGFAEPQRQDVIVFLPPHDPGKNYVKRIVGIPGDTLEMHDKLLIVNGQPQMEPFARRIDPFTDPSDARMAWQLDYLLPGTRLRSYRPTRDNWGPIIVPPDKYFALGDNRDNSEDSRYWGFLDAEAIRGRPMFVYYSFSRDPLHPFSWLTDVRWTRIGELIR